MSDVYMMIRQCLEKTGLGPMRVGEVLGGTPIFGEAGLLNSLELVHFITSLSEAAEIDPYDLMKDGDEALRRTFRDIHHLSTALTGLLGQAVEA
ncbi:MAG: hypothetical protein AB7U46_09485 [Paenirhodobacter sp.]|uniref:hypothetical protein n=1 Tax=Paenirhodobacter sp. TaxID=1965326 RepID=UPI003D12D74E